MKPLLARTLRLVLFLSLAVAALQGCGHGGTEVGNPPGPQFPGTEAPSSGDSTPSPSPSANLLLEEPGDEPESP